MKKVFDPEIGLSGMLADVALKELVEEAEEIDWNIEL